MVVDGGVRVFNIKYTSRILSLLFGVFLEKIGPSEKKRRSPYKTIGPFVTGGPTLRTDRVDPSVYGDVQGSIGEADKDGQDVCLWGFRTAGDGKRGEEVVQSPGTPCPDREPDSS